jgi:signal transduction histidine kinase
MPSSTCRKSTPANSNWKKPPSTWTASCRRGGHGAGKGQARQVALLVHHLPEALTLRGDKTRLQQAVLNYLSNAVKFTDAGQIEVGCQVLERTASDVLLRIEVKDTGIGIAPDVVPRLFSAFEQADNSTTRKYGGTGLGWPSPARSPS